MVYDEVAHYDTSGEDIVNKGQHIHDVRDECRVEHQYGTYTVTEQICTLQVMGRTSTRDFSCKKTHILCT